MHAMTSQKVRHLPMQVHDPENFNLDLVLKTVKTMVMEEHQVITMDLAVDLVMVDLAMADSEVVDSTMVVLAAMDLVVAGLAQAVTMDLAQVHLVAVDLDKETQMVTLMLVVHLAEEEVVQVLLDLVGKAQDLHLELVRVVAYQQVVPRQIIAAMVLEAEQETALVVEDLVAEFPIIHLPEMANQTASHLVPVVDKVPLELIPVVMQEVKPAGVAMALEMEQAWVLETQADLGLEMDLVVCPRSSPRISL